MVCHFVNRQRMRMENVTFILPSPLLPLTVAYRCQLYLMKTESKYPRNNILEQRRHVVSM